jgi:hypothetical protein
MFVIKYQDFQDKDVKIWGRKDNEYEAIKCAKSIAQKDRWVIVWNEDTNPPEQVYNKRD